jgi:hypothetical protein
MVIGLARSLGISLGVAVLALVLLAVGANATPTQGHATAASGCGDPVVHDRYDGFHVGVPAGWTLAIEDGFIVVQKEQSAPVVAVVEPALLTAGQNPSKFFVAALGLLKKAVRQAGNSMSFTGVGRGGVETASIVGRVGKIAVAGQASLSVTAEQTAHGSKLAVFSAYWAPPAQLARSRKALTGVGGCYGPEPGTLFRIIRDQAFTYPLPPGWTPHELVDQLFVDDGTNASAAYLFSQTIPASSGVTDVKSYLQFMLRIIGIKIDKVVSSSSAPDKHTVTGGTEQFEQVEFLGSVNGRSIHGVIGAHNVSGPGVTSGSIRLALANRALWNSLNPTLLRIAAGIQPDFTQDDQTLLRVQQQQQGFSQQVAGFDQAIDATDIVTDPATGQSYEAPYSAYNANGPNGPGYYTGSPGNLHKLKIVTP